MPDEGLGYGHSMTSSPAPDTVVLDLDGTLVDSVYHHVVAWHVAFHEVGLDVPGVRLHDAIGMGGDRLVAHVAGDAVENAVGDAVRDGHDRHFQESLRHVRPLDGASELLQGLHERGFLVAVASSGNNDLTESLLSLLEDRSVLDAVVAGPDVDASKPAPDLVRRAVVEAGGQLPVVVGDAVWDMQAAEQAAAPGIGLLSGGVSRRTLLDAGAASVHAGPRGLLDEIAESPLGRP